jgi:hypothetical protein
MFETNAPVHKIANMRCRSGASERFTSPATYPWRRSIRPPMSPNLRSMDHAPRPDGKIVEAANYGTRMEADAAIALLEANGIQASGKYGDAGGWMPYTSLVDGFRVVVFDEDLDAAKELLDAETAYEADLEPDAEAP